MERRTFLKGAALGGGILATGGIVTNQFVGGARGAVTSFGISDPPSGIATPDGTVNAVGYTFDPLVFEWGGLDTTATWGGVQGSIFVEETDGAGNYKSTVGDGSFARDAGQLGEVNGGDGDGDAATYVGGQADSETSGWGGANDGNTGPGLEGAFYVDYETETAQRYDLVTGTVDDGNTYIDSNHQYATLASQVATSSYPVPASGNSTYIRVRVTVECAVYDGDPSLTGTTTLASDNPSGSFTFQVTNEATTGTTTGSGSGGAG